MEGTESAAGGAGPADEVGGDVGPRNIVAIFHASFHPTKGNTLDWSLTSPSSPPIDLSGIEFTVLPSGLHLVPQDVVYFTHNVHSSHENTKISKTHTGLAIFRRRPTKNVKHHRGFRLSSLGVLLEESDRPRPWMHLEALNSLADEFYRGPGRRERESESEAASGEEEGGVDLLGLGEAAPGDLRESDFECARKWFEERTVSTGTNEKRPPVDVWSGWSDELDGTFASKNTPTHHLPHLLRILGLSSLTLYKFVLARRRILIYTLPPVEVAGVLAWAAADMCREHHMSPRSASAFNSSKAYGIPMPDLFASSSKSAKAEGQEQQGVEERLEHLPSPLSPTVLGMITLNDIPRLEHASSTGKGWIACTTDAIFLEKPQYYDLVIDLTTCTPSKASRPSLFMTRVVQSGGSGIQQGGRRGREKWKLESVRFTWSDVKLWNELDRILKLDSSQTSSHAHPHASGGACCSPKSPSFSSSGLTSGGAGVWADAFKLCEDVCLLCASLWMGLGTWRSNSRQSFASRDLYDVDFDNDVDMDQNNNNRNTNVKRKAKESVRTWGSARAPGDEDWSIEGTMGTNVKMRMVGAGIEGQPSSSSSPPKKKEKGKEGEAKIRAVGLGIEGRPASSSLASGSLKGRSRTKSGQSYGHGRKASGSSTTSAMKIPTLVEVDNESYNQDQRQRGVDFQGGEGLEEDEDMEELRRQQNIQTTLALLQTFHANSVFWLSKLREMIPPSSPLSHSPSYPGSPGSPSGLTSGIGYAVTARGSTKGIRLPSDENEREQGNEIGEGYPADDGEDENETITISARDLLALELGVLSELDAKFVEWLVEAEGYTLTISNPVAHHLSRSGQKVGVAKRDASDVRAQERRKRKVVVKRGWQELFGILLGLK